MSGFRQSSCDDSTEAEPRKRQVPNIPRMWWWCLFIRLAVKFYPEPRFWLLSKEQTWTYLTHMFSRPPSFGAEWRLSSGLRHPRFPGDRFQHAQEATCPLPFTGRGKGGTQLLFLECSHPWPVGVPPLCRLGSCWGTVPVFLACHSSAASQSQKQACCGPGQAPCPSKAGNSAQDGEGVWDPWHAA